MPALRIVIKHHKEGDASLTCHRPDGTVTWQRQRGSLGAVFPPHDLTHYAIETTLGIRHAFFGLVAAGWDISDFTTPWPRGPLPIEALQVEVLVGCFDTERRQFVQWTAAELNAHAELYVSASRYRDRCPAPSLTDEQVGRIRMLRDDLLSRWSAVPPGESLELAFDRGDVLG